MLPEKRSIPYCTLEVPQSSICSAFTKYNYRRRYIRWKKTVWTLGVAILGLLILYLHFYQGVFHRFFEKDFCRDFSYPLNVYDFRGFINRFRILYQDNKTQTLLTPTNRLYSNIEFLRKADSGCRGALGLLIIVKSATGNFVKRNTIRNTWGHHTYLNSTAFSSDLPTKLVFVVGLPSEILAKTEKNDQPGRGLEASLFLEHNTHNDIVQADFIDSYYNNTYKSISALRWATEICSNFQFMILVDDDMYLSVRNLVSYFKNPVVYDIRAGHQSNGSLAINYDYQYSVDLAQRHLYFGKSYEKAAPIRNRYGRGRKWYISIADYPYNYYPSYITGMATVFSKSTVADLYYASFFTMPLDIDDVYLGILAYKMKIDTLHSNYFRLEEYDEKTRIEELDYLIAVHRYEPNELVTLWKSLKPTMFTRESEPRSYNTPRLKRKII